MRIAYIAAGAAGMYCGSCLHDNTLAGALIERGHDVALMPTYTPMRTDEVDVSIDRIFYGAVNVFLEQKYPAFRNAPKWVHKALDRPWILRGISRLGASTDSRELGALTLSVLQGEEGRQSRELEELVDWLVDFRPDVVQLTNSMFLGLARRVKERVGVPVICGLPGEDIFLEDLNEPYRTRVFEELRRRAADADLFVASNVYFAGVMGGLLGVESERIRVVPLGVRFDDAPETPVVRGDEVVIGYLARICPEKGLHLLLDAFRELTQQRPDRALELRIAGYLGPGEAQRTYLQRQQERIENWGLGDRIELLGEIDRDAKLDFLHGLDILSVPTVYRESKGLYVLEAMAQGIPVVQPDHGTFPELVEETGGGLLVEPGSAEALAEGLAALVDDAERRRSLGEAGRRAVRERHDTATMAAATEEIYREVLSRSNASA